MRVRLCRHPWQRRQQHVHRRREADHGQDGGHQIAPVEAVHRVLVLADLHAENADDGGDQAKGAGEEREEDPAYPEHRVERDAENHGPDVLGGGGLEQVRPTAGTVAHVVAHEVGDDGGVAGVVLGDPSLDLAHEVGADVGRLGVDPAPELGEERHEAGAEGEADDLERHVLVVLQSAEEPEEPAHAEEAHRNHCEAGHRAAPQRDLKGLVEAGHCRGGTADVGADGDEHPDQAGDGGAQRPDDEGDRHLPERALPHLLDVGHVAVEEVEAEDRGRRDHREDGDGAVLAGEEGPGPHSNGIRYLAHLGGAGVGGQHLTSQDEGHPQ